MLAEESAPDPVDEQSQAQAQGQDQSDESSRMSASEQDLALITGFYEAFERHDWAHMGTCYADDATFTDPAFPNLSAEDARLMWRMLIERGSEMTLTFERVRKGANTDKDGTVAVLAHWEAKYPFGPSKRRVHNKIDASFLIRDGKIVRHVDKFDFWTWSSQSLGLMGKLMGWTSFLQNKVQSGAGAQLKKYKKKLAAAAAAE